MQLGDVRRWAWLAPPHGQPTGHVVVEEERGWVTTLCRVWCPGQATGDRPERICEDCRKRLRAATVLP